MLQPRLQEQHRGCGLSITCSASSACVDLRAHASPSAPAGHRAWRSLSLALKSFQEPFVFWLVQSRKGSCGVQSPTSRLPAQSSPKRRPRQSKLARSSTGTDQSRTTSIANFVILDLPTFTVTEAHASLSAATHLHQKLGQWAACSERQCGSGRSFDRVDDLRHRRTSWFQFAST